MSQAKQILFGRESAKLPGLRGNVGYVGAWVSGSNFYVGCMGYIGQNMFYVGPNFYVGCVGHIHFCVGQFFYVGQDFLRELKFLARF